MTRDSEILARELKGIAELNRLAEEPPSLEYGRWERVYFAVFRQWPRSVVARRTAYVRAWTRDVF